VFLDFELPAEMVDVNVHPAKMEVRFREPSRLYKLVLTALRTAFLKHDLTAPLAPPVDPSASAGSGPTWSSERSSADVWARSTAAPMPALPAASRAEPAGDGPWGRGASGPSIADRREPQAPLWERDDTTGSCDRVPPVRERAVQMHDRYIVVECGDGIEVIDQHALHERLLYEKLKAALTAGSLEVQPLLIPERIDLSAADLELLTDHAEPLARAGLRIEPFGGATVVATSKPVLVGKTPAEALVREVLERLTAVEDRGNAAVLVDEVLHGLACKAAIKAGDALSPAEVEALVRDRRSVRESHHCPHGRPTSLVFSRAELDRQFRRT
jgi:DNA mismatch repair protein MutL